MGPALELVNQPNLHVAWNPTVASESRSGGSFEGLPVSLILLADRVPDGPSLPLHFRGEGGSTKMMAVDDLSGKTIVFDADYLDWDEVERDVEWWKTAQ